MRVNAAGLGMIVGVCARLAAALSALQIGLVSRESSGTVAERAVRGTLRFVTVDCVP